MELIKVEKQTIGNDEVNAVDARTLWIKLESKQQFADWIKNKVITNPFFKEKFDWDVFHNNMKAQPCTSQPLSANRKDYALTLDTAKKVAMSEQTLKGNKVREYFIECEKRLNKPISEMQMISQMALQLDKQNKEQALLKQQNNIISAKQDILDAKIEGVVGGSKFYTILGYINTLDYQENVDIKQAGKLGRRASKLSKEWGYKIGSAPDVRFGIVNTYHEDVLDKIFD